MQRQWRVEADKTLDELASLVIGAAIEVDRHPGPGYLESLYKAAKLHLGLLINFNVSVLRDGMQRIICSQ